MSENECGCAPWVMRCIHRGEWALRLVDIHGDYPSACGEGDSLRDEPTWLLSFVHDESYCRDCGDSRSVAGEPGSFMREYGALQEALAAFEAREREILQAVFG